MAEEFKIIQMYNSTGAEVFPKTMAEIVKYDNTTSVKQKIEALVTAGGEPNVLTAVKWNGEAFEIADKAVDIYDKVSTFVSQEIGKQIHMSVEVVESLPTAGEVGKIYLVDEEGGMSDVYVEYIWVETTKKFERIGTTATDLTGYATETFVTTEIGKKVTELGLDKLSETYAPIALVGRVEALEGKVSTWDGKQDALTEAQLAAANSGITAAKVGDYDAYVAVERYSKTDAEAMAEGKASAAIEALDLPNTYAAKGTTEQHIADTDIHVNADQVAAIANVANKADKTIAVNDKTLSVLYFEEVTA